MEKQPYNNNWRETHEERGRGTHDPFSGIIPCLLFGDWYQKNPAYKEPVEQLRRMLEDLPNEDMRENTSCLHDILNESGMLQQLNLFGDSLQHQGRFYRKVAFLMYTEIVNFRSQS